MKKFLNILKRVYGYGILIALFVGGATSLGYIVALIIGGNTAAAICSFIYDKLFLVLIIGADVVVLIGLLVMYLSKEKSMVLEKKK